MNRTVTSLLSLLTLVGTATFPAAAQEPAPKAEPSAQSPEIRELIDAMTKAEAAASRIRLQLFTEGNLPGDLTFETRGSLRVLRTAQGETQAVQSTVEYSFADGLSGRMESVRTPKGVWIREENPAFGKIYVHIDPVLLADLDWAGKALNQAGAGLQDPRAGSPLGRAMVEDLARRYDLAKMNRRVENGQDGIWYGGPQRQQASGEAMPADMPIADRVELFVRESDKALMQIVFLQGANAIQRIRVDNLVIGEAMPLEGFKLDDRGEKPQDVREHQPMWEQMSQLIEAAEKETGEKVPSKR
jgi:hypothetical protein